MCWSRMRLNAFKKHLKCATGVLRNAASAPDTYLLSSMSSVEYTSLWCIKSSGSGVYRVVEATLRLYLMTSLVASQQHKALLSWPASTRPHQSALLHCCHTVAGTNHQGFWLLPVFFVYLLPWNWTLELSGQGWDQVDVRMRWYATYKSKGRHQLKCGLTLTSVAPVGKNNKRENSCNLCRRCRIPCQCK